jgi:hypothetical protein
LLSGAGDPPPLAPRTPLVARRRPSPAAPSWALRGFALLLAALLLIALAMLLFGVL